MDEGKRRTYVVTPLDRDLAEMTPEEVRELAREMFDAINARRSTPPPTSTSPR